VRTAFRDLLTAFQFLTRIPVPAAHFHTDSLAESVRFFPLVGLFIGLAAGALRLALAHVLDPALTAAFVLLFLVMVTGAFHEDGLADAADGLGGGWNTQQVLTIMRDSRIGSYGAIALVLSLLLRWLLLSRLPAASFLPVIVAAHVLCRWTTLPLSYYLQPARAADGHAQGQGARVAQHTSRSALLTGSLLTLVIVLVAMRAAAWKPIMAAVLVSLCSGWYYRKRIGGVTGDCFGATNQLTEIAVYLAFIVHP
jgi:adenosylcobinamide-GDP ribazoletransferase